MLKRYISQNSVFIHPDVDKKETLFEKMCHKAMELGYITSVSEMVSEVLDKEGAGITELMPHVVLPHARGKMVKRLFVMLAVSKRGIPYQGIKKNQAQVVIFIGIPETDHDYLKLLASVSRLLQKKEFVDELVNADVVDDVLFTVKKYSGQEEGSGDLSNKKYLIILSLNKAVDGVQVSSLLAEVGVDLPTEIEGKNLGHASFVIPFLSTFGFSGGISKYNRVFLGLTDEKDAASKLFGLLKKEGMDLNEGGNGSLFQIEVMASYGGFAEDVDF